MRVLLKQQLYQEIKDAYPRVYPLEKAHALCHRLGKREANGERRLRELVDASMVERLPEDETKPVEGYKYVPPSTAVRGELKDTFSQPSFLPRPNALTA